MHSKSTVASCCQQTRYRMHEQEMMMAMDRSGEACRIEQKDHHPYTTAYMCAGPANDGHHDDDKVRQHHYGAQRNEGEQQMRRIVAEL